MNTDTLQAARLWVNNGFSIIPIAWRSKRPAFDALKLSGATDAEGTPEWETFKERQPTDRELWLWFGGPRRNLGVVTGWHGLVVLDFDQVDAYSAWLSWAAAEGGQAASIGARTYRVFSARGVHVYLLVDENVESYKVPGIDIKGAFGYVVAPPSCHPSGYIYRGEGTTIARCERLADVFPFARLDVAACIRAPLVATEDPWEAASHAVDCGGDGAVLSAKARLAVSDLVPFVHRDRGGAWALCPLHRDTKPSLRVYPDDHWFCFGCGAHGDVIDLYARMHRLTNREAIATLAR